MSKRKTMDKAQARERRNQLLDSAAAAQLSLTEGVREMRAISGMTQEEFAKHREVSARVIKALELGQGNPTVATLNRIGQFFGLEVGFVPVKRSPTRNLALQQVPPADLPQGPSQSGTGRASFVFSERVYEELASTLAREIIQNALDAQEKTRSNLESLKETSAPSARKKRKTSSD